MIAAEAERRRIGEIVALYLRPEPNAHFHWRFGILVAISVVAPLVVGGCADRRSPGIVAALAAWFIALAVPPRTVRDRLELLVRRLVILTASTAAGVAAAPSVFATVAVIVVLALAIPAPGMTITPLIAFLMAVDPPPGTSPALQVGAFAAGGAIAVALLLLPAAASPVASDVILWVPRPHRRIAAHVRTRSPELRYVTQVAVAVTAGYLVLRWLAWPHAGWVLVGVLTTLRPAWDATRARLVKRSVGMIGGAALSGALLVLSIHTGYWATVAMIAVCAGTARPLRQYNYGYWPILGTPVLLLLVSLGEPLSPADSALRLVNNLLGAAVTVAAVCLLWPHESQRPHAFR